LADVSEPSIGSIFKSETSDNINQTLGIHPKIETVNTEHSESLKSRKSKAIPLLPLWAFVALSR
jgi:hypothetical protein